MIVLSGCGRAILEGDKTPMEKVYFKSQSVSKEEVKDIKTTPIPQSMPSYYPVINPPEIKRVWILPHITEEGNLVGGYWIYIITKQPSWYIEENGAKENIKVIIPYKEEQKQETKSQGEQYGETE